MVNYGATTMKHFKIVLTPKTKARIIETSVTAQDWGRAKQLEESLYGNEYNVAVYT